MTAPTEPCTCTEDGYCPRYGCTMFGHLRKICRGEALPEQTLAYRELWLHQPPGGIVEVNGKPVESRPKICPFLGDELKDGDKAKTRGCPSCQGNVRLKLFNCNHAALRPHETTTQDCLKCEYRPKIAKDMRTLVLKNHFSPGDVLVMTAAVRSLHVAHPGKFLTAVDTTRPSVWDFNPDVVSIERARELIATEVPMHYPAIDQCNQRGIHFMQAYCEYLEEKLGVRIPLSTNRPLLFLSKEEKGWMDQVHQVTGRKQRFAVLNAGYKDDYTTKHWGTENYQRVVDALRGRVLFVQVGASEHRHRPLQNVLNLIGKTDVRQLIRLCWHADFGLGGVTFLQHIMAAWQKPYFCLLGGREPVQWTSYPLQQSFHTLGLLPCCKTDSCWKSRTVPLGDGQDQTLCANPITGEEPIPQCMALIDPEQIVEKIRLISS